MRYVVKISSLNYILLQQGSIARLYMLSYDPPTHRQPVKFGRIDSRVRSH